MPVTKTAKRALRGSIRKNDVNKNIRTQLGIALRIAKRDRTKESIKHAIQLSDRAAKKHVIHKNKAAHTKSMLSKFSPNTSKSKIAQKKTSKKK